MEQLKHYRQQLKEIVFKGQLLTQHAPDVFTLHEALDNVQLAAFWLEQAYEHAPEDQTDSLIQADKAEVKPETNFQPTIKSVCEDFYSTLTGIADAIGLELKTFVPDRLLEIDLIMAYSRINEAAVKYHYTALYYERLQSSGRPTTHNA